MTITRSRSGISDFLLSQWVAKREKVHEKSDGVSRFKASQFRSVVLLPSDATPK